jgi:queuine tRNA-ribosyltransferase
LPETLLETTIRGHIIFWDPFSPKTNPELWTTSCFQMLKNRCHSSATIHTYSAATATRSALLLAGFVVGSGVATGAKAQTTTAALELENIAEPLGLRWLQRLQRSTAPLPSDADPSSIARIAGLNQFRTTGNNRQL